MSLLLTDDVHERRMKLAVEAAHYGSSCNFGGPFGCAIIRDRKIVAISHNTVLLDRNPTCHAEVNAIRVASRALKNSDLSDCELYTTCEPCPMCWGAIKWAGIKTIYIGVTREDAAEHGWSDEYYYTELARAGDERNIPTLKMELNNELQDKVKYLFESTPSTSRMTSMNATDIEGVSRTLMKHYKDNAMTSLNGKNDQDQSSKYDEQYMRIAIDLVEDAITEGKNRGREPFGAVIVKGETIVGRGVNHVTLEQDPTSTAELNAITDATKTLRSFNLDGCVMYCTGEPDVMGMGAIYWANIKSVFYGSSLGEIACHGFDGGLLQYNELNVASNKDVMKSKDAMKVHRNVLRVTCREVFTNYSAGDKELY